MTQNRTIKEIADELNISKQAVWQRIKRNKSDELDNSMIKKGNTIFVDEKGQRTINSWFSNVDDNNHQQNVNVDDNNHQQNVNVDDNNHQQNVNVDDNNHQQNVNVGDNNHQQNVNVDDNNHQQNVNVDDNNHQQNVNVDDNNHLNKEPLQSDELIFLRNLVKELQEEKKEVYRLFDQQQQLSLQDKKTIQKYENENKRLQKITELNKDSMKQVQSKFSEEFTREKINKKPWWKIWKV